MSYHSACALERSAGQCSVSPVSTSVLSRCQKVICVPSGQRSIRHSTSAALAYGSTIRSAYNLPHRNTVTSCASKVKEVYVGHAEHQISKDSESSSGSQNQPAHLVSVEEPLPLPMLKAEASNSPVSTALATMTFVGGLGLLALGGYFFKDQIGDFIDFFIEAVEAWGPAGYIAYGLVYTGLEVLAVPAIPLTMTAGVIFGTIPGTLLVSLSGTLAAGIAFLISRYAMRDKVRLFAAGYPQFEKIDKAIAKDGLKFVTLLRLSPLLPLAVSNYIYGLTSVDFASYMLGSWLGMLPGTYAYVSAGEIGKAVLTDGEGSLGVPNWEVALALAVSLGVIGYVGNLAKQAIEDQDTDEPPQGGQK